MIGDIDIDLGNRRFLLDKIEHVDAMLLKNDKITKHPTGIYVTDIPYDALNDCATIDYKTAESIGYYKIDLLNVGLYNEVRDEAHMSDLMKEPDWSHLNDRIFVEKLTHIGNHYDSLICCPEPVNSIPRMAMFLSIIRPAKRYLVGMPWKEVAKEVWIEPKDRGYWYKKSHAISYAWLVAVHMNLLYEQRHKGV